MEHVKHLAVEIGSRPIGSPANQASADYIEDVFKQCGLSIERQEIPCRIGDEQTSLELNGEPLKPRRTHFLHSCDITAETVSVCTLAELEAAEISGKGTVFYGDLAGEHNKGWYLCLGARREESFRSLSERSPAGIITIIPTLHAMEIDRRFRSRHPIGYGHCLFGLKLLKNPGSAVRMKIVSRRSPGSTANLVGRLPGDIPQRIVFCANYDLKVDTPGAYDNAAGVGVLLALAQILSGYRHRHTRMGCLHRREGAGLGDMEYACAAMRAMNSIR